MPYLIFEDNSPQKCQEFIDSITVYDRDQVAIIDYDDNHWKDNLTKYITHKTLLCIFNKSHRSMASARYTVADICTNWYAVHLRRFTEKDLSCQYYDVPKNNGTFIPKPGEDTATFANRVVQTVNSKELVYVRNEIKKIEKERERLNEEIEKIENKKLIS
jgi:hypothetical protein